MSDRDPRDLLRGAAAEPTNPVDVEAVLGRASQITRRRRAAQAVAAVAVLGVLGAGMVAVIGPDVRFGEDDATVASAPVRADLGSPERTRDGLVALRTTPADAPAELSGHRPSAVPPRIADGFEGEVIGAHTQAVPAPEPDGSCGLFTPSSEGVTAAKARAMALFAAPGEWHEVTTDAGRVQVSFAPAPALPPGWAADLVRACIPSADLTVDGGHGLVQHVWDGWTLSVPGNDVDRALVALAAPDDAAWAVVERRGWWLAVPAADGWAPVLVPADPRPEVSLPPGGVRAVWVDAAGRVLGERHVTEALAPDAPIFADQSLDGVVGVRDAGEVRTRIDSEGGARVCEDRACAWVVADDAGDLIALSAAGPGAADAPPLGWVAPCGDGTFGGTSGNRWNATGSSTGPGIDLHRYAVSIDGDEVRVDFGSWIVAGLPDPPDEPKGPPPPTPCDRLGPDPFGVDELLGEIGS